MDFKVSRLETNPFFKPFKEILSAPKSAVSIEHIEPRMASNFKKLILIGRY